MSKKVHYNTNCIVYVAPSLNDSIGPDNTIVKIWHLKTVEDTCSSSVTHPSLNDSIGPDNTIVKIWHLKTVEDTCSSSVTQLSAGILLCYHPPISQWK
jgi:hypothetical protein